MIIWHTSDNIYYLLLKPINVASPLGESTSVINRIAATLLVLIQTRRLNILEAF